MKFIGENKKKQLIYLGVILGSLGVMYWLWFGGSDPLSSVDPASVSDAVLGDDGSGSGTNGYLPLGTTFKTNILESDQYKDLIMHTKLSVSPEELGRKNPFSAPGSPEDAHINPFSVTLDPDPYEGTDPNFSLIIPQGWGKESQQIEGVLVIFSNPVADGTGSLTFRANITVAREPSSKASLDEEGVNESIEQLKKELVNVRIIDSRAVTTDSGHAAWLVELTHSVGTLEIRQLVLAFIDSGFEYNVFATGLDSTWEGYAEVFENSVLSFTL